MELIIDAISAGTTEDYPDGGCRVSSSSMPGGLVTGPVGCDSSLSATFRLNTPAEAHVCLAALMFRR